MIRLLYNLVALPLMWASFRALALKDEKTKLAFSRRKNLFAELKRKLGNIPAGKKRVLVHVSSVGEYLQAKPLILAMKKDMKDITVILSYLSASLEGQLERNPAADIETYLPFDTPVASRRFLEAVRPDLIVFSTYDVWPNLLWRAADSDIPTALVNASLAAGSGRFKPLARRFFGPLYSKLQRIGAISENDAERYRLLGVPAEKIEVTGNCRFDQTIERAGNVRGDDPVLSPLPKDKFVLVAGSTWPEDEAALLPAFFRLAPDFPGLCIIVAPHEPKEHRLEELERIFAEKGFPCERLSRLEKSGGAKGSIRAILVDGVGYLFKLYRAGAVAFIGGSFGKAVHNVMEPAAFGLPVLFGPRHNNSQEALLMKERGGAYSVAGAAELEDRLRGFLSDEGSRAAAGERARAVVEGNLGATERTMRFLVDHFPGVLG